MTLSEILLNLLSAMERVDDSIPSLFGTGLSRSKIETELSQIGFRPSNELLDLYSWRDGGITVEVLPGMHFLPFEAAVAQYEIHGAIGARSDGLLRFLSDGSDSGLAVESKELGGKVFWDTLGEPPEFAFPSIASAMNFALHCYERGIFRTTEDGIDVDWDQYETLKNRAVERDG